MSFGARGSKANFSVYPMRKDWADLPTEGNLLLRMPGRTVHYPPPLKAELVGSSNEISELSGLSYTAVDLKIGIMANIRGGWTFLSASSKQEAV